MPTPAQLGLVPAPPPEALGLRPAAPKATATSQQTIGGNLVEFGKGIPGGAVSTFGTAVTGAGAGAAGFNRRVLDAMDRIDAGETVPEAEDPIGYGHMNAEQRRRARAELEGRLSTPVTENPLVETGRALTRAGHDILPAAPGYERSIGRQLGAGAGSVLAGVGTSLVAGPAAAGALFTLAGSGEAVERAIQAGATDEQIIQAARKGVVPGLTDSLPVETLLGRVPLPGGQVVRVPVSLLGRALKAIGRIGWQAFVEGAQEGGQQFLQNLIARDIYAPDQALTEGVLPDTAAGGGVGAVVEGVAQAAGLRARGHKAPASLLDGLPEQAAISTAPPAARGAPVTPAPETVLAGAETASASAASVAAPGGISEDLIPAAPETAAPEVPAARRGVVRPAGSGPAPAASLPRVFHGTQADFERFEQSNDIGFHFTTSRETAEQFAEHEGGSGRVIEATLDIRNPLRIDRDLVGWHPFDVAEWLDNNGFGRPAISKDGLGEIGTRIAEATRDMNIRDTIETGRRIIWEELARRGFDSIVYPNQFEGKKVDTYIVPRDDTVRQAAGAPREGSTPAAVTAPAGGSGAGVDSVVTPRGQRVGIAYDVVELDDLAVSHTPSFRPSPDYPASLQPRDRSRAASQDQVGRIAANLNPELLGRSATATEGAPIVGPDGVVESGNARVMALREAYARNLPGADAYRHFLKAQGYDVAGMRQPVLVRRRTTAMTDAERQAFTREANERSTLDVSPAEQATADAAAMPDWLLDLYQGGGVGLAQNREFARRFLDSVVSGTERARLLTDSGDLSQEGLRRIDNALFAKAYSNPDLLAILREDPDTNIKAIGDALTDAAPAWAKLRSQAAQGAIPAGLDATRPLMEAVALVRRARNEGRSVADLVAQRDAFTMLSPEAVGFLHLLFRDEDFRKPASRQAVADALRFYAGEAMKAEPGPSLLSDVPEVTTGAILALARQRRDGGLLATQPTPRMQSRQTQTAARPVRAPTPEALGLRPAGPASMAESTGIRSPRVTAPAATASRTAPAGGGLEPDFAGNINLNRIAAPADVKTEMKRIATANRDFIRARRGVMSHEETRLLALQLGMTEKKLMNRRLGQAFNSEELFAARQLLAASAENLMRLAQAAQGGSDADLAAFQEAMTRHVAIQEQVAGMTAEAGRALAQFRMIAGSDAERVRQLKQVLEGAGGRRRIEDLAGKIAKMDDPAAVSGFAGKAYKAKLSDKILELWINALLSSPLTHSTNILSNALTALWTVPEHALAAGIGAFRRGDDKVFAGEAGARLYGFVEGSKDGLRLAGKTLVTGEPADAASKLEARRFRAISGRKGEIVRIPGRLLMAEDEFFKSLGYTMELNAQAMRQARREGLKGQALLRRVAELKANPPEAMRLKALDESRYLTFTKQLGAGGQAMLRIANSHPLAKVVFPFVRTPINLFKFAAERSPFGLMMAEVRENLSGVNGKATRDIQIARMTLGTMVATAVASLAAEGLITGGGPSDPEEKAALYATGWQPYSLKLGGEYYSYSRLEPLAMILGVSADMVELADRIGADQSDTIGGMIVGSISQNLVSKTWLRGISELLQAVQDPDRYADRYIARLLGTVVPTGVAHVARLEDPTLRDIRPDPEAGLVLKSAQMVLNSIRSRLPGQRETLPARRDVFGRPIAFEGSFGPDALSPIYTSRARNDPVANEIVRLGLSPSTPERTISGVELAPRLYEELATNTGETVKGALDKLVANPAWPRLPDMTRREIINNVFREARKAARMKMLARHPELARRVAQERVEQATR